MPADVLPELHPGCFLVRVGIMGRVGRFQTSAAGRLKRRDRVVCRTQRGLEVGSILGPSEWRAPASLQPVVGRALQESQREELFDGRILRKLTAEDDLLWEQLQRLGSSAHQACEAWLDEHSVQGTLLEVEPLLDGRTLYFHFLSEVSPEVQSHLDRLVGIYEAEVQKSKFARLLEHGCGPGCGTEKAVNGCGTRGGCAVCSVAAQCGTKPQRPAGTAGETNARIH